MMGQGAPNKAMPIGSQESLVGTAKCVGAGAGAGAGAGVIVSANVMPQILPIIPRSLLVELPLLLEQAPRSASARSRLQCAGHRKRGIGPISACLRHAERACGGFQ